MDELRTSANRMPLNENEMSELSTGDNAKTPVEIFQAKYPAAYDTLKFLNDACEEIISALDAALPWFDVYKFLRFFSRVLCVCLIADYSIFLLAIVVVIRKVALKERDPALATSTESNIQEGEPSETRVSSLPEGRLLPEGTLPSSESQGTKTDLSPTQKFVIDCALDFGKALMMYYPSYIFSATVIFVIACLPDFKKMGDLIEKGMKNVPKVVISAMGPRLLLIKDSPQPAIVAFLNQNIQEFWSYIEDDYMDFVTQRFPDALKTKCHLIIHKRTDGIKMPPTILSAKVKETEQRKVLLDVNLFCNGDFAGTVRWNTGGELSFENIQIDSKLQLELSYVRMVPEETVMLSDIVFRLKKINKLDLRLKETTLPMETIKPVKKLFIDAAQSAIQSYFPCHLKLLDYITSSEIEEPSRPESQNVPSSSVTNNGIQKILNEFSSSPQQAPAPSVPSFNQENTATRTTFGNGEFNLEYGRLATSPSRNFSSVTNTNDTISSTESTLDNFASAISFARDILLQASNERTIENAGINSSGIGLPAQNANSVSFCSSSGSTNSSCAFGQIELTTVYQPPNTLIVTVHQLRNLPMCKGRPPNPYVKLLLQCKHERWTRGITGVVEGSNNPVIEMYFTFKLHKPLSEYTLQVNTKSKHKHNHALGEVMLSFTPSIDYLRVKERSWYDLHDPKKEQTKIPVFYKETF